MYIAKVKSIKDIPVRFRVDMMFVIKDIRKTYNLSFFTIPNLKTLPNLKTFTDHSDVDIQCCQSECYHLQGGDWELIKIANTK